MPAPVLSPAALKAQLVALQHQLDLTTGPVVAFHGDHSWNGGASIQVDQAEWAVLVSRSPLQIREVLADRGADSRPLVILTPLSDRALGADVMARVAKRRLLELDAWEPVLRAFGASRLDGRLAQQRWMAEVLLTTMPGDGYPPVATGTLDARTAWRQVLRGIMGVDAEVVDLGMLLTWSLDSGVLGRWSALPEAQRRAVGEWIQDQAGVVGRLATETFSPSRPGEAIAVGLACGAIATAHATVPAAQEALIRLERLVGGSAVDPAKARSWAEAAGRTVQRLTVEGNWQASAVLDRADVLLGELGAESASEFSRWSPKGYAQRLDRLGKAIRNALESHEPAASLTSAADALRAVQEHERSRVEPERVTRVEHAVRLARYVLLRREDEATASFPDAVRGYAREHAFADIARPWLASSEPSPVLAQALARLSERVVATREQVTAEFGRLLAGWFENPSAAPEIVPVENVIQQIVGPLASVAPVLLLVVDGMNLAVADAIVNSIQARGWCSVLPDDAGEEMVALAALPSVTEVCRASLFTGKLISGTATHERTGFTDHPVLLAVSRPGKPPRLFHKADLGAGTGLASDVAEALGDADQRVVGAVVNAVDDHLLREDMVRPQWTLEYVPILGALVDAARSAGRVIVLTSDHGHLLDLGLTRQMSTAESDRHRLTGGAAAAGELRVKGPRVVTPTNAVVVASSELVRFGRRKNGYHGGASPQEVVIPLDILTPEHRLPAGYRERERRRPVWWDLETRIEESQTAAPAKTKKGGALPLFDESSRRLAVATPGEPAWLAPLFVSDAYLEQRERASRTALPQARLRTMLVALASRGGRMTVAALADHLGVPAGRVPSIVAASGQVLNFDGYQSVFLSGDDVVLDVAVLTAQFLSAP